MFTNCRGVSHALVVATVALLTFSGYLYFALPASAHPPQREPHVIAAPKGAICGNNCTNLQALRVPELDVGSIAALGTDLIVSDGNDIVKLTIPPMFPKSRQKVTSQPILKGFRGPDFDRRLANTPDTTGYATDYVLPGQIAIASNGDIVWHCYRFKAIFRTKKIESGYGDTQLVAIGINSNGLAIADDNTIYTTDSANDSVFAVKDGTVTRILGTGEEGNSPDGTPASEAAISGPGGVALLRSGRLIVVTRDGIKTISPGGTIETLGASGDTVPTDSPVALHDARFEKPGAISVAGDDIYVVDHPSFEAKQELTKKVRAFVRDWRDGKSLDEYRNLPPDRIYKVSLKDDAIEPVALKSFRQFIPHITVASDGTVFCTHPGSLATVEEFCEQAIVAYPPPSPDAGENNKTTLPSQDARSIDELLNFIGEESPAKKGTAGKHKQAVAKKNAKAAGGHGQKGNGKPQAKGKEKLALPKPSPELTQTSPTARGSKQPTEPEKIGSDSERPARLDSAELDDHSHGDWKTVKEKAQPAATRPLLCCNNLSPSTNAVGAALIANLEKGGAQIVSPQTGPDSDYVHTLLTRWLSEQDQESGWEKAWREHIDPRHGTVQAAFAWQRHFGEPKSSFTLSDQKGQPLTPTASKAAVRNLIAQLIATKHTADINVVRTSISIIKTEQGSHWRLILRGHFKNPIGKTDLTSSASGDQIDGFTSRRLQAVFALTPNGIRPITAYPL